MAGRINHAKRSHNSYRGQADIFRGFERKAYMKSASKVYKKDGPSPFTILASKFKRLFSRKSK
jgi:hypothetical protein